jgi:FkbM family methyltransferase
MHSRRWLRQLWSYGWLTPGPWPVERFGSDYGGWWISVAGLGPESVVYSFGVGTDVSFDLALIDRFCVTVHAFDPTPRSISWVRQQVLPPAFVFHEYGLAAHDGSAPFQPPLNPAHVSYAMTQAAGADTVTAPVLRLATIMDRLGHLRVDLLKMDIEGAEYEVIADLARGDAPIGQLLVEFHHRNVTRGWRRTRRAVGQLRRLGFSIAKVAPGGNEVTFVRRGAR